jgi:hypothetical protein
MRRFGWQIGGLFAAAAIVVMLALLAFGCGNAPRQAATPAATASAHATATPDARAAAVEAAARRYVQALADSMRTGGPDELGGLAVPGSQAAGNAGVAAHVVHDTGRCFVVTSMDISRVSVSVVGGSSALASVSYTLTGYDADFPSLKRAAPNRSIQAHKDLEFQLEGQRWLVLNEH